MTSANPHIGSSLDAFLAEEGILDETRDLPDLVEKKILCAPASVDMRAIG